MSAGVLQASQRAASDNCTYKMHEKMYIPKHITCYT